jgi:hypothetical protein
MMSSKKDTPESLKRLKPVVTSATVEVNLGASNFVIPEDGEEDNLQSPLDVNDKKKPKMGFLATAKLNTESGKNISGSHLGKIRSGTTSGDNYGDGDYEWDDKFEDEDDGYT